MAAIPVQIPGFFLRKARLIGLDVGSSSIKLVEIAHQQGKPSLLRLGLQEVEPGKGNQNGQLEALKHVLKDINIKGARVSIVINCPQSCTKISVIPFMPKSEIMHALKWEMKNFISFPIDEAVLDYCILQEIHEAGVKKLKVAVACCPRETVDRYLGLLRSIGIKPSLFTQHAFALKNVAAAILPDNKTAAFLDMGHCITELIILRGNEIAFSRRLPAAGRDLTEEMTQTLVSDHGTMTLTCEEAERIKREYGLLSSDCCGMLEDRISSAQLIALQRPSMEKLVTEVERSFAFYREKEHGDVVESLFLLGGGCSLKNLAENLAESLRIPVSLGNPLAAFPLSSSSLSNDETENAYCFASALGAALASPDDINLLPVEIKQQTRLLIKRSTVEALVTAVVAIVFLLYVGMKIKLNTYEKRIAATESELGALSPQIEELPKQAFLGSILDQRIFWSDALKEISNLIPESVHLTEMSTEQNTLILRGEIESPDSAGQRLLTEFMRSLEGGILRGVNLVSAKNSSQDAPTTFELRASVE